MRGFPSPITSRSELISTLTMIIFTASVQHAAINFNQFDMLGYPPNMPLSLTIDRLPESKDQFNEELIFNMLPTFTNAALQTVSVWTLTQPPILESESIMHPLSWDNPNAQRVVDEFVDRLKVISKQVDKMNEGRDLIDQYTVLNPINIPKATKI